MGLYVDDSTLGTETTSEGNKFYQKAKIILSGANFGLRKWVTNRRDFLKYQKKSKKSVELTCNLKKADINFIES